MRGLTNCFIAELIMKGGTVMKKPVVDWDLCIGCGSCVELCPEVFELKDEKAYVIGPEKCDTCNCQEAVEICPVVAISWEE
jgi:ferredoxin